MARRALGTIMSDAFGEQATGQSDSEQTPAVIQEGMTVVKSRVLGNGEGVRFKSNVGGRTMGSL